MDRSSAIAFRLREHARGSPLGGSAADGREGEKDEGHICDSALRHQLTIRNYVFEARINTPEKQTADNDYAVGKLIEKVAHGPYAGSTLIFVIEDDAQDGPDHVDVHRTIAFVAGPYVKQGAVVHERYSTVNMVRTIEDVLGLGHLNFNDEYQPPLAALFDLNQAEWNYTAITPASIAREQYTALKLNQHASAFHDAQPSA